MVRFLIQRPVAVCMAFTAFFLLGIITYVNIPVSLLPDIAIPEITVQITGDNTSARELENTVVTIIRQQLQQIGKMRDIRTETRDGNALILINFNYGTNTDLAFIEVNEKIDAAMNYIPKEISRPRVIKASATDIPVFNLYLTLKNDDAFEPATQTAFLDLCEFAETVIRRRIEQLPQVAMVDMSGLINKQVLITPYANQLEISGITLTEIESVLNNHNVEPGGMVVRDGYYEYNIKFSSVLRTVEDIRNVYIHKNGKIFRLDELADIEIVSRKERGMILYNGKQAVSLAVIKQAAENMARMEKELGETITYFSDLYPDIDFSISQSQTELLNYSIANLKENLMLAFLFICLVSIFFLKDFKSPLIIGFSIFVSLIISLLFFYLFKISLNVVSLTGLILALGMMVDNSIIVTDNIGQYRRQALSLEDACVKGTNEVITPMLSSMLTTIAIFLPLIFLSGIAGAIFFDQAFSVTVGLIVSYIMGITLLPVLYRLFFSIKIKKKIPFFSSLKIPYFSEKPASNRSETEFIEKVYHSSVEWIFRHKFLTFLGMLGTLPLCLWLFTLIPKEKMPAISQNELIVAVDWNENIHVEENKNRVQDFFRAVDARTTEHSALIAQQQFILNRNREQTSSEAELYLKTEHARHIPDLKREIETFFQTRYPSAIVAFAPPGTVFEKIFATGEPDLTVEYYNKIRNLEPEASDIRQLENFLEQRTGESPAGVAFQKQLNLQIDREKLLLYKVSTDEIYRTLKTSFRENQFANLRSYQQYLPIVLGSEDQNIQSVLDNTLIYTLPNEIGERNQLPLSFFLTVVPTEDIKTIVAGKNGEYIPIHFYNTDKVAEVMAAAKESIRNDNRWEIDFSGEFFSNKKMIGELIVILLISILLMYFILAAQFENFLQPLIVMVEIPIDIAAALGLLYLLGHTLNLMSAIGIVVTCGIVINDSILKIDAINQFRKEGMKVMDAIHEAGRRRLKAIILTCLTSVVGMAPLLISSDLGAELEKPLAIATIGGMIVGTLTSLIVIPLFYWWIYRKEV
jgi:multidrug efflux pump subunit AcrB